MKFFSVHDQLCLTKKEREKHIKQLKKVFDNKNHHWDLFKFLYENLNIVDQKASSLLQYNSVIFATIAIFYVFSTHNLILAMFYLYSMVLILISSILCLNVVWIHWSCTEDFANADNHIDRLIFIRDKRTKCYRFAWNLSLLSALIIVISVTYNVLMDQKII